MVVTPPTLAQLSLVGIAPILALVAICCGSWLLLLLQAAKESMAPASSHFAEIIICTPEPKRCCVILPLLITRATGTMGPFGYL